MISFRLSELAEVTHGTVLGDDVSVASVSTDSRKLNPGDFYVALKGPHFDGHDFLQDAARQGAAAAMVSDSSSGDLPCLEVRDTRVGLGQMAAAWRQRSAARVAAVTGSNGKTTVKEMLAAILARKGSTLATMGNLNNDIGLPLTLCRLQDEVFAVVELGANHPGEIDYLSRIARPDVAVLNNAGCAHLEGFGNLEGVARAKAEILNGLAGDGVFVYNADDSFAPLWRRLADGRASLGFGLGEDADIRSPEPESRLVWDAEGYHSEFTVFTPAGNLDIQLNLPGEHNRMNALAAIAAAQVLGASRQDIEAGLAALEPVPGRLQSRCGRRGMRIIDDSYNANPDSVRMAIEVLRQAPGRGVLVLGDLGELGTGSVGLHQELGRLARQCGVECLFTCGELSAHCSREFGDGGRHFTTRQALLSHLDKVLAGTDTVLVKGSRAAAMDEVVQALCEEDDPC
ncbi:UDP-N-acetylmuramoyl-tripeptide--D-alanyl-D-alanine ligase [Thiolapillus brandeum]|uniref:UDP-N-acetylmuramoyl-tripeptide--D-alanyl-D-alanine ligase n=1 Tax=Thiolapillus brandeum TaxID=1076588 RepID=A0A7U6GH71_9GAMM|nr:UDP-N-acetylmuramoyl-tripeptide--D-alanyl-D-alanine ligase [Thiolapillus brandeum]BAO43499.1 UDP-N-acetylmuramoylalanyl-D-glutamyl-26-diaminopimelate--D-alanyl-D-alanine ligase [Thiolapillus brandeum]